jgi:predicted Ser/Thr protein kinase/tetratricopeptide (TPR) repeat protein
MPFSPGVNVGPYRVIEQLGQGGMASVYKAYHPALDRYVALKVLHPAFMEDPSFLARFQREARVVAKLEHPNIVPVYDFSEHEGQPYLVMKYIEGRTLKAVMADGPIAPHRGLEILEAVGAGLSYAHRQGILHRDIKPSNILIDKQGAIYLADFGLARIAQAGESTLSSDMLLGTPQYISPEQARGERALDAGTDIYSLGVVIYEMVVGRVPFNADTPFSIIHDHIYTPLPMPRSVNPNVPEDVQRVLLKALAKERADRYETVEDLVQAFGRALGQGVASPAGGDRAVRAEIETAVLDDSEAAGPGRRRWWWAAGGLVLACLCLFVFLAIVNNQQKATAHEGGTATVMASTLAPVDDPEVAAARGTAQAASDSPQAQLDLAQALFEAGYPERSALALASAGQLHLQDGAYLDAGRALVLAIERAGDAAEPDGRWMAQAEEALYLSADSPSEVGPLLERMGSMYPKWGATLPISARMAIYDGRLQQAIRDLESAQAAQSDDPIMRAVLAEAYLLDGRRAPALNLARGARTDPASPQWLVRYLDAMIRRMSES